MARVIALAQDKGGVTKTTSTANLGALLAEAGKRVLMIDGDPQMNLSEAFGFSELEPAGERLEDLLANPASSATWQPPLALRGDTGASAAYRDRLWLVPCTSALADVVAGLPLEVGEGYELRLSEVVDQLRSRFDYVLIDTPPGRQGLSMMALLAADELLIPTKPADHDVSSAGKLYDLVETELPDLRILGVFVAVADARWKLSRATQERLLADEMTLIPVVIPTAVRVASAPREGAPTAVLEPDSRVTCAYRLLATHIEGVAA